MHAQMYMYNNKIPLETWDQHGFIVLVQPSESKYVLDEDRTMLAWFYAMVSNQH